MAKGEREYLPERWSAGRKTQIVVRLMRGEELGAVSRETLEEARERIGAFIERCNREWLLERHGHRTPADVRQQLFQAA